MRTHQVKFLKLRPEALSGFIYLVQVVGTDKFKIGRTTDVPGRLRHLQIGNPLKIRYVYHAYVQSVNVCEMELHHKFSSQREIGEWFTLTQEDVKYCILLMRLVQVEQPCFLAGEVSDQEVKTLELENSTEELEDRAEQVFGLKARGWSKEKIILEVWGATKGGSQKYRIAEAEYKHLAEKLVDRSWSY